MLGLQYVVTLDIRLQHIAVAPPRGVRGLKFPCCYKSINVLVAPPRGVRGLKCFAAISSRCASRRTPSWGAWIEILFRILLFADFIVAPPRGVRGLKCSISPDIDGSQVSSHPLVGCVD